MHSYLDTINFKSSSADPCLFISHDQLNPCYVHVHVDDMTIAGTPKAISLFKTSISNKFEMEDLGEVTDILGMSVTRNRITRTISLSQESYVDNLLTTYGMQDCKPVATPLEPGSHLAAATEEELEEFSATGHNYRKAVGSVNYLVQCTRPELAFASSQLSQHLDKPGILHWAAFRRVLRYLQGTRTYSISFRGNNPESLSIASSKNFLTNYADADWAGDPATRRSTTGYVFTLHGGAVSWMSRKQPTVSLSSTEAEYKATVEAGKELAWLRIILEDLNINLHDSLAIQNDNQGAIALAENPVFQARSKHIEVQYHWIREQISAGKFELKYTPTAEMQADLLTKSLPRVLHQRFCEGIGLLKDKT